MAEPPTRITYRADNPGAYASAILALMRLARDTSDDFTFGPLRLDELERDGLDVGGPDLAGVIAALVTIPGLAPVDL